MTSPTTDNSVHESPLLLPLTITVSARVTQPGMEVPWSWPEDDVLTSVLSPQAVWLSLSSGEEDSSFLKDSSMVI